MQFGISTPSDSTMHTWDGATYDSGLPAAPGGYTSAALAYDV